MQFSDIAGSQKVIEQLIQSYRNNKLSHALLFSGNEGTGGLAMALAFSQYLLCENPTENDSCGSCDSCQKNKKFIHPDLHFTFPVYSKGSGKPSLSADFISEWRKAIGQNPYIRYIEWINTISSENKQGNISMAECHDIIKRLSLKSYEGGYKIQIIWMAEHLGKNGNSLLKIIEEPPQKTLFIFIANNSELILNTIRSRTQSLLIPPILKKDITDKLVKDFNLSQTEAENIANIADGDFSEALRLYHKGKNEYSDMYIEWMRMCYKLDMTGIISWSNRMAGIGREQQKDFLRFCLRLTREALIYSNQTHEINYISEDEKNFLEKFSAFITNNNSDRIYKILNESYYHIERNASPKIIFFELSLQINKLLRNP